MNNQTRMNAATVMVRGSLVVAIMGMAASTFFIPPVPAMASRYNSPLDSMILPCVLGLALVSCVIVLLLPGVSQNLRLLAGVCLIGLIPGCVYYRRYSVIGVLLLGGSHYWVQRAVSASSDETASLELRRILGSSQYGLNVAETGVLRLPDPQQQARLFSLLAGLAPSTKWRDQYLDDARHAIENQRH